MHLPTTVQGLFSFYRELIRAKPFLPVPLCKSTLIYVSELDDGKNSRFEKMIVMMTGKLLIMESCNPSLTQKGQSRSITMSLQLQA